MNQDSFVAVQEVWVNLQSQITTSINVLVDLTLAWSERDFARANDRYAQALAHLDHAARLIDQARLPPENIQVYREELQDVRASLGSIGEFLQSPDTSTLMSETSPG